MTRLRVFHVQLGSTQQTEHQHVLHVLQELFQITMHLLADHVRQERFRIVANRRVFLVQPVPFLRAAPQLVDLAHQKVFL